MEWPGPQHGLGLQVPSLSHLGQVLVTPAGTRCLPQVAAPVPAPGCLHIPGQHKPHPGPLPHLAWISREQTPRCRLHTRASLGTCALAQQPSEHHCTCWLQTRRLTGPCTEHSSEQESLEPSRETGGAAQPSFRTTGAWVALALRPFPAKVPGGGAGSR